MTRKQELLKLFECVDENQRTLIINLIDEFVFQEEKLKELQQLPFIRIHPKNAAKQESTPAQKQYKEISQAYTNIAKVLLSVLNKVENAERDPVAEFMEKLSYEIR